MSPGGPPTEPGPQTVGQDGLLEEEEARVAISHPCCHPSALAGDVGKGRASPAAPEPGAKRVRPPVGHLHGGSYGSVPGMCLASLAKRASQFHSLHLTLCFFFYMFCVLVSCRVPAGSW